MSKHTVNSQKNRKDKRKLKLRRAHEAIVKVKIIPVSGRWSSML